MGAFTADGGAAEQQVVRSDAGTPAGLPAFKVRAVTGVSPLHLESRIKEAWRFAVEANGWPEPALLAEPSLEVVIDELPRGTLAQATGAHRILIAPRAFEQSNIEGVLAHELTHVMSFRVAGTALRQVPRYLEEGKALWVGHARRAELGESADDPERARAIETLTADECERAIRLFRDGPGYREAQRLRLAFEVMTVAVFFIEFLRTHGAPDVVTLLSRVYRQIGRGTPFSMAFARVFGTSLEGKERAFIAFVKETAGDRQARLAGTIYERP